MSVPGILLPDGTRKTTRKLTYREARYVSARLADAGTTQREAALVAGFPVWMAREPGRTIETGEVETILNELQGTLAEHAVEASLIDAAEIHEYLTECIRADMRDIRNDDGSFKPQSEWPAIWGRMMEAGDCEIETSSERSHDGATKDKAGGWDAVGTVTKVKLKFARRTDLLKLAMQHRGVNAMVQQDAGDVHIHVTIEGKLQRARLLAAGAIIDVTPEPV